MKIQLFDEPIIYMISTKNPSAFIPRFIFYQSIYLNLLVRMSTFTEMPATEMPVNKFETGFTTSYSGVSDEELYALIPEAVKAKVAEYLKVMSDNSGESVEDTFIGKTGSCRGNALLAEYIHREIQKATFNGGVLPQTMEGQYEDANGKAAKEVVYDVATRFTRQVPFDREVNLMVGGGSSQKTVLGPDPTPEQNAIIEARRAEAVAEYNQLVEQWNAEHPDAPRSQMLPEPNKDSQTGEITGYTVPSFENVDLGIMKSPNFLSEENKLKFRYYLADAKMLCEVLNLPEHRVVGFNAMGNTLKSSEKAICTKDMTECPFTDPKPEQVAKLEFIWEELNNLGLYGIIPNRKVDKAGASWCNQIVRVTRGVTVGWDWSSSQLVKYTKRVIVETDLTTGEPKEVIVVERAFKALEYCGDDKLVAMMTPQTVEQVQESA